MKVSQADVWPTHYKIGMWAYVLHRITGVVILLSLVTHVIVISTARGEGGRLFDTLMKFFENPVILALELLLMAVILFHMINGIRILLFDLGIGIRAQKPLLWASVAAAAIVLAVGTWALWPFLMGQHFS